MLAEPGLAERPPPTGRRPRLRGIEVLRGLGALAVLIVHVASTSGAFPDGRLASVWWLCGVGGPVFFVVSGFVLYGVLDAVLEGHSSLGGFLVRRVLRAVPAYWIALTLLALYPGLPSIEGPGEALRFYGFLQIYEIPYVFGGIAPAWTLCVEMTFYGLLAFVALTRSVRGSGRDGAVFSSLLAGLLVLHAVAGELFSERAYFWLTHTLLGTLDWFIMGILLAIATRPGAARPPRALALLTRRGVAWPLAGVIAGAHLIVLDIVARPFALISDPAWGAHLMQGAIAVLMVGPMTPAIAGQAVAVRRPRARSRLARRAVVWHLHLAPADRPMGPRPGAGARPALRVGCPARARQLADHARVRRAELVPDRASEHRVGPPNLSPADGAGTSPACRRRASGTGQATGR